MNGYIPINKPVGITSHDVVAKIRRIAGTKKVGHTGTLDPIAEGLMIVCVGKCTKSSSYITGADKGYIAEMKLGVTSDTYDITGTLSYTNTSSYEKELIEKTLLSFIGKQKQFPPMYSAKKVNGKKLYELARKGESIDVKPSEIEIYDIEILNISDNTVEFYVYCSKGTYIRSLIHDFGKKLGCGAVMTKLKRTRTSGFDTNEIKTYDLEELTDVKVLEDALLSADYIFRDYKRLTLSPLSERIMKNGIPLNLNRAGIKNTFTNGEFLRVYNENDEFLALCKVFDDVFLKLEVTFFDN